MALILVVDDNEIDRRDVRRKMERFGYEVVEAEGGEQALEIARTRPVDLILLDRQMPAGMDGKEVLQQLKTNAKLCEIPVLIVTGSILDDQNLGPIAEFIALGADDYLTKNADEALLRARVANCVQRKQAQDRQKTFFRDLQDEQRLTGRLLNALLPKPIVAQILAMLRAKGSSFSIEMPPQRYPAAAVMFCDIVNFTEFCEQHDAQEVIRDLNRLVSAFDELCLQSKLEKIKTIGDAFMTTANMLEAVENPVRKCIECALAMQTAARDLAPDWKLRIGINFGSFVAGIVGTSKFQFDIWGRTVNLASRVESEGENGEINLSLAAWNQIEHFATARVIYRELKGFGKQPIYVFSGFADE